MIDDVLKLHKKFGLPDGSTDQLSSEAMAFRLGFLKEELQELQEALEAGNRVDAFDALLDLTCVAYGTALFMGIDPAQWHAGFRAVHQANMAKVRVEHPSASKRGSGFDLKKPEGWVGPEAQLEGILSWFKD